MAHAGIVSAALPSAAIGLRPAKSGPDSGPTFPESFAAEMESGEQDGDLADDPSPGTDTVGNVDAGADTTALENIVFPGMAMGQGASPDHVPGAFPISVAEATSAKQIPPPLVETPHTMQAATGPRETVMTALWYAIEGAGGPMPLDAAGRLASENGDQDINAAARILPVASGHVVQSPELAASMPKASLTHSIPAIAQAAAPTATLPDGRAAARLAAVTSLPNIAVADSAISATARQMVTGEPAKIEVALHRFPAVASRPDDRDLLSLPKAENSDSPGKTVSLVAPKAPSLPPPGTIPPSSETILNNLAPIDPSRASPPRAKVPDIRIETPHRPVAAPVQPTQDVSDATAIDEVSSPFSLDATKGSVLPEATRDGLRSAPFVAQAAPAWPGSGDIARQLSFGLSPIRAGGTDIILNPAELGKVRLRLRAEDNAITLQIIAERPETADLMRRHIDSLVQEFRTLGYQSVNLDFGQTQDQGNRPDSNGRADRSPAAPRSDGPRQDIYPVADAAPDLSGSGRGSAQLDLRM